MRATIRLAVTLGLSAVALILIPISGRVAAAGAPGVIEKGDFRFAYDANGISGLANPHDPYGATVVPANVAQGQAPGAGRGRGGRGGMGGSTLGLLLRVGEGETPSAWTNVSARGLEWDASPENGTVTYSNAGSDAPVKVVETFKTDGKVLDWSIDLESTKGAPVQIGNLGVNVPAAGPFGENPTQIFEHGFLRHQFISGNGSFFFFVRASGAPPFLTVTVEPGTHLEYFGGGGGRGGAQVYVHSSLAANEVKTGTWRQKNTSLKLNPAGTAGSKAHYGFRFQWADSYDDLREILYREGLFDVRVAPGMTIPIDLSAHIALHTKARIDSLRAEFPDQTKIIDQGERRLGWHVYEVEFKRLGENKITIHHDGDRETYLEYFVTEPIETLIKKRASFIINRQQIRDPSKWWDGVFGPYDMSSKVVRTIDDPDIFLGRMVYVLTCDDPGLSKAPYVAEKNASFPDQKEIEGLEYYLQHFVWGKLQRTDAEQPYPYGVYGTPNWYVGRDPVKRKELAESSNNQTAMNDLGKEHIWRSYDYPHVVMLYYHMYEIAKKYPKMSKYLDAAGYLERAFGTAKAFFTYPYEIYPTYYETYKWGLYNELVVLKLADALDREGFPDRAAWLRREWEKKVKYFVYDDTYPFRSEYAFDRTAFESSYALAKYGATHDMRPDQRLWWDWKQKKWYSHPLVRREDSRAFMDRQLAAGLSVRGWMETSYYQLGADPGLSYMAAMGGWGILDYAVNFADNPGKWLPLGYASYLSSWCLMNTGTAETNYGYWYPGEENDGAAGWQFMSSKAGSAWMGSSFPGGVTVPRGPWRYDGEIDLGFCGALRMSATIVTRDPVFDWIVYGGALAPRATCFRSSRATACASGCTWCSKIRRSPGTPARA